MAWVARAVALAFGLRAAEAGAPPAGSLLSLATRSPVPANGVLVFEPEVGPMETEVSVVVVGPVGLVTGVVTNVARVPVWTPDRELTVGGHTVEVTCANPYVCRGFAAVPFTVVEAQVLAAPVVACNLTLAPAKGNGTEEACCGSWEAVFQPEPHCFTITLNTHHVGYASASCQVELSGAEPEDLLYRATEPPQEASTTGQYPSSIWFGSPWFTRLNGSEIQLAAGDRAVPLAVASEYCLTVELMDTRTGIPSEVRHCVPDPGWEPVEVPNPTAGTGRLDASNCEVPPPGFEDAWCVQNSFSYAEDCFVQDAAEMERPTLCAAYEGLCLDLPLPPPADRGCMCRAGAGGDRAQPVAPVGWVALLGLLSFHRRRRSAPERPRQRARVRRAESRREAPKSRSAGNQLERRIEAPQVGRIARDDLRAASTSQ